MFQLKYLRIENKTHKKFLSTSVKKVLGIECTCDDTGIAIVDTNKNIIVERHRNQWEIHKKSGFAPNSNLNNVGGIIPNLAAKLHSKNLMHCTSECIETIENGWDSVDAIALSVKPGLEICLWQGIKFTRLLLNKYKKPFIPIHHMESHALTPRLFDENLKYPYLALLISGGHTLIVLVKDCETFIRFGETTNLPIGNCIDKVARRLGLYRMSLDNSLSGGALIEKYAKSGDQNMYISLTNKMKHFSGVYKDCSFSYGGLCSATYFLINDLETRNLLNEKTIADICASFQQALLVQLKNRLERAIIYYNTKMNESKDPIDIVIAGGVASNKYIFENLQQICLKHGNNLIVPPAKYCTDNGVMIAWNGCEKFIAKSELIVNPNEQTLEYLNSLKPIPNCELGINISKNIRAANIKIN